MAKAGSRNERCRGARIRSYSRPRCGAGDYGGNGFRKFNLLQWALTPGLELAHHPWRKSKTYEDDLGKNGLAKHGKRWNKLLEKAIAQLEGSVQLRSSVYRRRQCGENRFRVAPHVTRIPNEDGLLGGVMLWKEQ